MTIDDRATLYLDMLREERFTELTGLLRTESPQAIVAFCRLVAKYENVTQLEFIRSLLGDEERR